MNASDPAASPLFKVAEVSAFRLTESDLPVLQDFFVANPDYFLAVNGVPPRPDEARQEFEDRPPPEMPLDEVFVIGFVDGAGRLIGVASVLSHLLARNVWHIGLFIVATSMHGTGTAPALYGGLEAWMKARGALWVRLGAVAGNGRAEHFWEKQGYAEVRRRVGMTLGERVHTVRVFVKPLGAAGLEDYLSRVARDRPESTLP